MTGERASAEGTGVALAPAGRSRGYSGDVLDVVGDVHGAAGAKGLVQALHEACLLGRGSPLDSSLGEFVRSDVLEVDRTPGYLGEDLDVLEYTVTTSPVLVSGVYSLLTAAWEAATDLEAYLRGEVPELAPEAREILRVLGAGLTDEAAARRLGTSLRTYRRRVAELMAALEAGSRFQAGVRAGELGLAR
jgi:hypothetical protein